jgi:hypothetical protein
VISPNRGGSFLQRWPGGTPAQLWKGRAGLLGSWGALGLLGAARGDEGLALGHVVDVLERDPGLAEGHVAAQQVGG